MTSSSELADVDPRSTNLLHKVATQQRREDMAMKLTTPVDIAGLARLILSPECKSIAILSGAGVSVAR